MYAPDGVKTSRDYAIPDTMKAWVLGDPGELSLREKPVPVPKKAEVLVREGRRAEADAELAYALAYFRGVGASAYTRRSEALLAATA